ncbi:MAG TPA: hypothetical protein VGG91_05730 [Myxococcaceae bacterium]
MAGPQYASVVLSAALVLVLSSTAVRPGSVPPAPTPAFAGISMVREDGWLTMRCDAPVNAPGP